MSLLASAARSGSSGGASTVAAAPLAEQPSALIAFLVLATLHFMDADHFLVYIAGTALAKVDFFHHVRL